MTAPPAASSAAVRSRMQAQGTRDTHAELVLRRALRAAGVGYRVQHPIRVPGWPRLIRADVALPAARVALFVDGDWWHKCPRHWTRPTQNAEWWVQKVAANVARDAAQSLALADDRWTVVRVWECALRGAVPCELTEFVVRSRDHARARSSCPVGVVMEMGETLAVRAVRRAS